MSRRRRRIRTNEDWKKIIKECRHNSKGTKRWGCLSKDGMLFRIATFSKIRIPSQAIKEMVRAGELILNDAGFFEYIPPKNN